MKALVTAFALTALTVLAGCGSSQLSPSSMRTDGSQATASFNQFSDIPIPGKASMNVDQSLLLGHGDGWLGRLVYTTWSSPGAIYDLYKSDMPAFGWQEITSVRGATSVQTWQRADRIATIQISETIMGEETIVTVAPAVGAGSSSGAYSPQPPAPAAAPQTGVTRQPLR
ncbi:hypothetical protein [Telmatospirillum sp.]|uniref:hypothetical protein n=1 Tax=Telmatospirillum sp. TaxID=2079197 RepID=UPI0028504802|nr:hypothetical protein [Telmatospirillum sp.]MDR3435608.1 hypothetical protein [Telmatospirillum sp.]